MKKVIVFALVSTVVAAAPRMSQAQQVAVPDVPPIITAPAGTRAFLSAHAIGTQNYICLPSATGVAWTLAGPQATLFNDDDEQVMTHFLSPNPDEAGIARATWQHSRATTAVWAMAVQTSSDAPWVTPGSIPWLLLKVVGDEEGPDGGNRLTLAKNIQRVNTVGGVAPATGCALVSDVGRRVFVPYEADYVFYREVGKK